MFENKFISAVIVAAGSSTRMKSKTSKQLLRIGSKTVLETTVGEFEEAGIFDEIIIVCPKDETEAFKSLFIEKIMNTPLKFTHGGETRQRSVSRGVESTDDECSVIAIHDGARPLVKKENIISAVKDGITFGAATLAVPVKDTIKTAENGTVSGTPPREKLFIIQTPQVFDKKTYLSALRKAETENMDFTDDCQVIESVGGTVHITIGDYTNIKLTTPEDIAAAETFLRLRNNENLDIT